MDTGSELNKTALQKAKYAKPKTEKHEPIKIIQGSGECSSLYYVALYVLYT